MNDAGGFRARAGLVGLCRGLYVASLFVLNIGLARMMGKEVFGSFQQVFIFNALFLVLTLGIPETMYYFLPRISEEERPRFLGQTLIILSILGLVSGICFALFAPYTASLQKNPDIIRQLRYFSVYGAFHVASSFADPVFISFKRIRYLFSLNAIHAVFLVGLTLSYIFMKAPAEVLFAAMGVFGFVKYILALRLLYRMRSDIGGIRFFTGKSTLMLQLGFALPVMLTTAVDVISRWLDKFVVSFFFGRESLGVFFVGALEIPFITVVISSVFSVVAPVLNSMHHKNDLDGFVSLVEKTLKFTSKIIWPIFIYFFVFAGNIIQLVFTDDYQQAITPFRIYLLLMPLRIASYGVIVIALGRPKAVFHCAALALAANFVLNIVLAMQIGFIGPAVATVISTWLHVAMLLIIIMNELKTGFRSLVPLGTFFSIGITGGLAVMIAYGVSRFFSGDLFIVISSLTVFSLAYLALGIRLGLIKPSDFLKLLGGQFIGKRSDNG